MLRYANQIISIPAGDTRLRLRQVDKRSARKAYESGGAVYMLACMMRVDNPWLVPVPVVKADGVSFDSVVCSYTYYNCNRETGKYPIFFVDAM